MRGGTGSERAKEREGFLLPHQSFGSCPTDANDGVSGPTPAAASRQRQGADLAEIQYRSLYQPPEVDLTLLFVWQWKRLIIQPVSPFSPSSPSSPAHYPELLRCAALSGLIQTARGCREAGHKAETRSVCVCVCGNIHSSDQNLDMLDSLLLRQNLSYHHLLSCV